VFYIKPKPLKRIGERLGVFMSGSHATLKWVSGVFLLSTFGLIALLTLYFTWRVFWKLKEHIDNWLT